MDLQFVLDTIKAVRLELYRYRVLAAVVFMLVTAGVLAFGYATPKSYTSQAVLYAEQSTLLQPLLRGQAEVTPIDRINEARELFQNRSFLEQVALDTRLLKGTESDQHRTNVINSLRNQLRLRITNRNFLEVSYGSGDPDQSFQVVSAAITRFVERSARQKRAESQGAFEFIDSQVRSYQRQLEVAENRLKEFNQANQDGTEAAVRARIETLRSSIENLKLEIQQTESELRLTAQQLTSESPMRRVVVSQGVSTAERRLAALSQDLSSLRLRYHDRHPDVMAVQNQIDELRQQIAAGQGGEREGEVAELMENPVYESLMLKQADARTRLEVQGNRLASLERLLEEAFARSERVAANQAQLAELTRDYNVTKGVYEDMLQRRERARLSMTLDAQGEGVSYRILEPASYPTRWDGLQLHQVGLAGPFLGSGMVLGLLVALVLFDQRVRSVRSLSNALPEGVPVLASIPHYNSTWKDRMLRPDVIIVGLILIVFMIGYMSVLVFSIMGVQPEQIINRLTGLFGGGANG